MLQGSLQGEEIVGSLGAQLHKSVSDSADGDAVDLALGLDYLVDFLLDGTDADDHVKLAFGFRINPKGTVGCLDFDGGDAPPVEMKDMVGGGQVQACSACLDGEPEEPEPTPSNDWFARPSGRAGRWKTGPSNKNTAPSTDSSRYSQRIPPISTSCGRSELVTTRWPPQKQSLVQDRTVFLPIGCARRSGLMKVRRVRRKSLGGARRPGHLQRFRCRLTIWAGPCRQ